MVQRRHPEEPSAVLSLENIDLYYDRKRFGDEQTAAVTRGKIAKSRTARQENGEDAA